MGLGVYGVQFQGQPVQDVDVMGTLLGGVEGWLVLWDREELGGYCAELGEREFSSEGCSIFHRIWYFL